MSVNREVSMAGTDAVYAGNDEFRVRKYGDDALRIHLAGGIVRVREDYYAADLNLSDLAHALAMVAAGEV